MLLLNRFALKSVSLIKSQFLTIKTSNFIKVSIFIKLLAFSCFSIANDSEEAIQLRISAIDWCPQICLSGNRPGYVMEIVEEVFSEGIYQPQVNYFPWSRAIKNVTSGQSHALLSPAKKEAPHLKFPSIAVGRQKMCFFVAQDSKWKYEGQHSLAGLSIGIATDTSIEELNQYMLDNSKQFQFQPYHERFVKQNALKVLRKRLDAFIFTLNTTQYTLKTESLSSQIKNAGCVSQAPIYIAFTSVVKEQALVENLIAYFEHRMTVLEDRGVINSILNKYQIE